MAPTRVRNPVWTRDELVLALDLYLGSRLALPGKRSAEVLELSATLNRLGAVLFGDRGEDFRNANGVYLKLMNFRSLDPHYTGQGDLPPMFVPRPKLVCLPSVLRPGSAVAHQLRRPERAGGAERPLALAVCSRARCAA